MRSKYGLVLGLLWLSLSSGSVWALQPSATDGQTLNFRSVFSNNAWLKEFNDNIIKGEDVPEAKRKEAQQSLDEIETKDQECAALSGGADRDACIEERDFMIEVLEKKTADNNPDLKILLSQAAKEKGDFSDEYGVEALKQEIDSTSAQLHNLMDMLGKSESLPKTPTKEALATPLPAGGDFDITQQLNVGADQLAHLRQSETETYPVSEDAHEGFFDKIRNFWQELKPGVQQALTINAWAQAPFGTLGQSGVSQLRVITHNLATADFDQQAKAVNDERDRRVTQHNDIAGQGKSALQERAAQNLEVMDETTKLQDQSLQSIEHICQNQRASIPCWENGNDIPYDLLALLMGATGGGSSVEAKVDIAPYATWLYCPIADQPFSRQSEGILLSGLFLEEETRLILTLDSKLPQPLHEEGCIVALNDGDNWHYYNATPQPEVIARGEEDQVEADLALLKIETIYTEEGQDLADGDAVFDDFINEYWPDHLSYCAEDGAFQLGDELVLYGFEPLEEEAVEVEAVTALNGLANFVPEASGAISFTTNGEETFNGGLVARERNGCFKGLADIVVNVEAGSNQQNLVPLSLIQAWLATQNITLPQPNQQESGGDQSIAS